MAWLQRSGTRVGDGEGRLSQHRNLCCPQGSRGPAFSDAARGGRQVIGADFCLSQKFFQRIVARKRLSYCMRKYSNVWRKRAAVVSALVAVLFTLAPPDGHAWPLHKRTRAPHPLLVGYFPQWGLYYDQPYSVKQLVDNGSAALLDQINYAQGFVSGGKCSVADPRADLNNAYTAQNSVSGRADHPASPFRGYFHQLKELKKRYPHLKILISLEGNPAGFAEDAKPENRRAFVASCIDTFIRGHFVDGIHEPGIFDGFDIDWESPHEEDAANFQALLEELRRQMRAVRPGLRLSIAVGH